MVFFLFLPVFFFVFEKNITVQNTTIHTIPEESWNPSSPVATQSTTNPFKMNFGKIQSA